MSILEQISTPADRPPVVTILGDAGLGKTSLAAAFPDPLFIRVEDGLQALPKEGRPKALPKVETVEQFWEQLRGLAQESELPFATLVIDSVTTLESMFIEHVVKSDASKPKSINQAAGGYGAGRSAVASMHQRVRTAAEHFVNRGVNVVFIAHADTEVIEPPDTDQYMRYNLRLHKKSVAPYVDEADVVGFIKLQTFTHGDGERKKAVSDGTRVLVTYADAANVSKNRYGIDSDLELVKGENPLVPYIPALQAQEK